MALVPFILFVDGLPPGPAGAQAALRGGLLLGVVYFGGLLNWILVALLWLTPLAVPAYLGTVLVLAAILGAVGWGAHRMQHAAAVPVWLAVPLAWTAGEWLRAHLPAGLAFPWLGLGTSLTGFPDAVGIAELVGARGVTLWLALTSGVVAVLLLRVREARRRLAPAAALGLLVLLPVGWGTWRAATLPVRPAARVTVVQPEVAEAVRLAPGGGFEETRRVLSRLTAEPDVGSPDLMVWPETVFRTRLLRPEGDPARSFVQEISRRLRTPILLGAYGEAESGEDSRHNSVFLMDSTGAADFRYHKHHLVPLVERTTVPGLDRIVDLDVLGGLVPGEDRPLAVVGGARFGVLVCYESSFADAAREYRRRGADFLINVTNDAWYGREPWYARTTGLWQHPAHLVMRAVENRVGVARSANGGVSMFVQPTGRVEGRAPLFEPAVRTRTVSTTDVRTVFSRTGDLAGPGAAAATLVLLLAGARYGRPGRS